MDRGYIKYFLKFFFLGGRGKFKATVIITTRFKEYDLSFLYQILESKKKGCLEIQNRK